MTAKQKVEMLAIETFQCELRIMRAEHETRIIHDVNDRQAFFISIFCITLLFGFTAFAN